MSPQSARSRPCPPQQGLLGLESEAHVTPGSHPQNVFAVLWGWAGPGVGSLGCYSERRSLPSRVL